MNYLVVRSFRKNGKEGFVITAINTDETDPDLKTRIFKAISVVAAVESGAITEDDEVGTKMWHISEDTISNKWTPETQEAFRDNLYRFLEPLEFLPIMDGINMPSLDPTRKVSWGTVKVYMARTEDKLQDIPGGREVKRIKVPLPTGEVEPADGQPINSYGDSFKLPGI